MKKFFFAFFLVPLALLAQKNDYVWITGDNNSLADTTRGGSNIDFNFNPPKTYYNYRKSNFRTCNSSICDVSGNLMFYTNGCNISGAADEILENGDGINLGYVHQLQCDQDNYYNSGYQSAVILPLPDLVNIYYLFHKNLTVINNPFDVKSDTMFYSVIDMSLNSGMGKVTSKNIELQSGDISIGELTAVKHANGKDWWLVTPKRNSNTFYSFLFTKDGVVDTLIHTIGDTPKKQAEGGMQVVFSPDGSKYFRSIPSGPVMMCGFDRTAGIFTDFDTIHVDYANWPSIANGCAVSPNGRFFYVCAELNIFQFDLWADDISASQVTVAEWDGFKAPVATIFGQSQLGPDCKIYVSTIDSKYYHVINNPDEPGLACNVTQHSFIFPTPTGASIPSFPNYRLGPLDNPGVPCTATVSTAPPPELIKIKVQAWPNPATDEISVSYTLPQSKGEKRLVFTDLYGRAVHETPLPGASGRVEVPVSHWAAGVYFFTVVGAEENLPAGKVIVRH